MISRFSGKGGRPRFISALRKQIILHDNDALCSELAGQAELLQLESGESIIVQGETDDEIYFLLSGRLSIVVNGREVAIRIPGEHVGEMALIDPSAKRSATVVAIEQSVVAKISETSFRILADKHPRVWQLIAVELCERLRQRNRLVPSTNLIPLLFVGSSKESLSIAQALHANLASENLTVRLWTDEVFGASQFPLIDLEIQIREADFAALVLGPDDEVVSRNQKSEAPRDNVIFELGLFMGSLTHERTFMIVPDKRDVKIPTDLLGLNALRYEFSDFNAPGSLLTPVCKELRRIINKLGVK